MRGARTTIWRTAASPSTAISWWSESLIVSRMRLSDGERKRMRAAEQRSSPSRSSVHSQRVEAPAAGWQAQPETKKFSRRCCGALRRCMML
ncbi:hypothetical protein [uncultured Alistipes sp.]|uniref:hypothetical protein n=1 Tax=uncultured Alistipes sp. TaxID=538949 RepID=UPI00343A0F29